MSALAYTSIYQLTFLLLETVEGKLTNSTLNDTFQGFLHDLNGTIQDNSVHDIHDLEAVRNSIYEYYENHVENEKDIEKIAQKLEHTFGAWHFEYPAIIKLAKDVLMELV